ncbi:glutathione S-transferase family protein [Halioxenophilus aromaticivorans]|uniref:Glutathione S-transferase n=1 Tax=Halioxenophilus aromaticivorans TaxID=1306992 RepID=A0AAV3UA65_9ALTE
MELYDLELSGNCYKVRLLAALAGIDLTLKPVDFLAGDHKRSPVIDLNPWGELPVLVDGGTVLRDSQAILVYLASAYAGHAWWPDAPAAQGDVMQWLSVASNEIHYGPNSARLVDKFGYDLDKATTLQISERILGLIDQHLQSNEWLAMGRPTIAECAVYPYIAVAGEGGIDLTPYQNINQWMARIKALPGYISMPGVA